MTLSFNEKIDEVGAISRHLSYGKISTQEDVQEYIDLAQDIFSEVKSWLQTLNSLFPGNSDLTITLNIDKAENNSWIKCTSDDFHISTAQLPSEIFENLQNNPIFKKMPEIEQEKILNTFDQIYNFLDYQYKEFSLGKITGEITDKIVDVAFKIPQNSYLSIEIHQ